MRNPYFVLGVPPEATRDEIKSAYRRLARAFHPDLNQDDFTAQERFAEINAAHQLLSDAARRRLFDEGLIDARGRPRPGAAAARKEAPFAAHTVNSASVEPDRPLSPDEVAERIFGEAYRREGPAGAERQEQDAAAARPHVEDAPGIDDVPIGEDGGDRTEAAPRRPGWSLFDLAIRPLFSFIAGRDAPGRSAAADSELEVAVSLAEVLAGAQKTVALPDGSAATLTIPAGVEDGYTVRFPGQGAASEDGPRADAVLRLRYSRHPDFRVEGRNLHTALPLSLEEAVFGKTAQVRSLDGGVEVIVPEWSGSDRAITVPGRGLPDGAGGRGDLVAEVRIMLSKEPDQKLIDLLRLRRGEWFV